MEKEYYSPKTGYTGASPLFKKYGKPKTIEWLETQPTYTLHKPLRKKYPRNKVLVSCIDEQWQLDLCDLSSLSKSNNGYKFLLNCIDIFSKFAWSLPLKTKSATAVLNAFKEIMSGDRKPQKIQTDAGTEFVNKDFQNYLKTLNIVFFTTNSELKASVVERFNRTLKDRMWRYFTRNNTYKYIDVLQDFLHGYNNSKHRTIGIEPSKVNHTNEEQILSQVFKISKHTAPHKFKVGDKVRISKVKGTFEKGYLPNFSQETFIIYEKLDRKPPVYRLKDELGETIGGIFYEPEMQKVTVIDDVYVIERILKTKQTGGVKQYFVKWRGYPDKFNSWVTHVFKM